MTDTSRNRISWAAQIVSVAIMGQTLFFKFSGAEESVRLFSELELEPHGRIAIGALELFACILLLLPRTIIWGAALGLALMAGAIFSHIATLGWQGERLQLGALAIVTLVCCAVTLWLRRKEIPYLKNLG